MDAAADISRDVLLRARTGDAAAFRLLVERLAAYAYNIAWRLADNSSDAEDLTQEVFIRLHRNLARYDPALPFLPWFRTLASRVCLNWRKRQPRLASLDALPCDPAGSAPEALRDPSAILQRELERLPEEYKLVLTYLYYEGLSVAEIAAAMGVPAGTVKTWLFRAREQLKDRLKSHVGTLR